MERHIKTVGNGQNYSAIQVGTASEIKDYQLALGPNMTIPGKVFIGQALGATGSEVSYTSIEPGRSVGFYHTHQTHEELYFIIRGKGLCQIDGESIDIEEGSVIRVAPSGKRSIRNTGSEALCFICVQYRAASFDASDAADGNILQEAECW